jgi:hypothetical protein
MQATIATRKPVDELTASDLEAFPVWEFAMDEEGVEEQDETWVKPGQRRDVGPRSAYVCFSDAIYRGRSSRS